MGPGEPALRARVTELEQQVEALRRDAEQLDQIRRQYEDLLEYAPVGYVTVDEAGFVRRANLTAAGLLGRPRHELVGERFNSLVTPSQRTACSAFLDDAREATLPVTHEVALTKGAWKARHLQLVATPALAAGEIGLPGRNVRIAVLDVTARKEAERGLAESEARFRAWVEKSPDGIAVVDAQGVLVEANPVMLQMIGRREEALGRVRVPDLLEDAVRASVGEEIAGLQPGDTRDREDRFVRPDGRELWANVKVLKLGDGRILAYCRDVTERRAMVGALRESEGRFRALAEGSPAAILHVGRDGRVTFANRVMLGLVGGSGQPPATQQDWSEALHPEDRARVLAAWQEAVAAGRGFSDEFRLCAPSGRETWVRWLLVPVAMRDGEPPDFIGVGVDMTETRALHGQIALSARLAAMGTLASGISHEVNNPLAAIVSNESYASVVIAEVAAECRSRGPGGDAAAERLDEVCEALAEARESAWRIARIVKDLATYANPESRRVEASLVDVAKDALRWLPPHVGETASVRLEDLGSPRGLVAPGQIQQLVVHLVSNAARATPPGKRDTVRVRVGTAPGGAALLEVVDHGCGIAPGDRERVFEPFFTTRSTGSGRGAGLGLSICRSIASAHGGSLTLESEVGRGSTFRLELPPVGG